MTGNTSHHRLLLTPWVVGWPRWPEARRRGWGTAAAGTKVRLLWCRRPSLLHFALADHLTTTPLEQKEELITSEEQQA